jgi:hypothetical protein
MRTFMRWAVVLVVPAVWVAAAQPAQQVVPDETTIKLLLLRQKSVQMELGLTPETTQKVMKFTNAQHEAAVKALKQDEAARNKVFGRLDKENEKFLTDTLTPKQSKRLDQITMQFTALRQLTKPEIAKVLKLSNEQMQKFQALQKEAHKSLETLMNSKEREGKNEKFEKLRQETRTKILALLTEEQKMKVSELAGPPFKGKIEFEELERPKGK